MSLLLSLQIFKAEARDVETEMRKELDEKMETLFSDAVLAAQLQLQEADILQVSNLAKCLRRFSTVEPLRQDVTNS